MNTKSIIHIENLHKTLQEKRVFDGLNLDVHEGETRVIVGGSGEGKSVLLKHIIGLMEPDSGRIVIDGIEMDHKRPQTIERIRQRISMVFQAAALFDSLTVRDNVAFALLNRDNADDKEINRIVQEKLSVVNLGQVEHLYPAELSGGMKKRVAIARALATEPKIILFDEPTTGLDPLNAEIINDLILELKTKVTVTQVVVTHDIHSSCKIADNISMLHNGKILATADTATMMRSGNRYISEFMNASMIDVKGCHIGSKSQERYKGEQA